MSRCEDGNVDACSAVHDAAERNARSPLDYLAQRVLLFVGAAATVVGGLVSQLYFGVAAGGVCRRSSASGWAGAISDIYVNVNCEMLLGVLVGVASAILVGGGIIVQGIGAKVHANGKAEFLLRRPGVTSTPRLYWLGWVFSAATIAVPIIVATSLRLHPWYVDTNWQEDLHIGYAFGWPLAALTTATFALGAYYSHPDSVGAWTSPQPWFYLGATDRRRTTLTGIRVAW